MGDCIMLHRVKRRIPKFTYDGSYELIDDEHGNWRIKFKSSGTLTFTSLGNARKGIDVFLVGGGAGGVYWSSTMAASAGGGAGYTKTQKNVAVTKGTAYTITIGAGSAGKSSSGTGPGSTTGNAGGATSAFGYTANGGGKAKAGYSYYPETYNYNWAEGGNGGSGGAAGGNGKGGTDGGNGTSGGVDSPTVGHGQGTTTREFGEPDGDLYAKGGGTDTVAVANSGNGGKQGNNAGSSGIVVIRNHR